MRCGKHGLELRDVLSYQVGCNGYLLKRVGSGRRSGVMSALELDVMEDAILAGETVWSFCERIIARRRRLALERADRAALDAPELAHA